MIKLNLGCGKDYKKGFVNCDTVKGIGADVEMDCVDLSRFKDGSVDLIFCHSFFEHLYKYQQVPFLKDCRRILNDKGVLVILGISDFVKVAKCFINNIPAQPTFGNGFSLYQAYRLTHGDCEDGKTANIPQMHKGLFDLGYLDRLFNVCSWQNRFIFRYNFPGENYEISLGIVAFKNPSPVKKSLKDILFEFKSYIDDLDNLTM